jgi:hypothetical protein
VLHRPDAGRQVNLKRAHCAKVEEGVSGSTRDFMKAEPNPSNEVLEGRIERTYQNAGHGRILACVYGATQGM